MSSTEVECPLKHVEIWSPTSKPRKWLLIAGASNPPENIVVSGRRPREAPTARSGKYLSGVNFDLAHMGRAVETELHNIVRDFEMTKNDATERIRKFFEFCFRGNFKPMLYYTGHGEEDTGNWCFQDGTIGIEEIFSMCQSNMEYPTIISDACFSGHWVNYAHEKLVKGFQCLSACGAEETALDTGLTLSFALFTGQPFNPSKSYIMGTLVEASSVPSKWSSHFPKVLYLWSFFLADVCG